MLRFKVIKKSGRRQGAAKKMLEEGGRESQSGLVKELILYTIQVWCVY